MRRDEMVVRTLVREWLTEAAEAEAVGEEIAGDLESSMSGLEALDSKLDSVLAAAEKKVATKKESRKGRADRIDEAGVTLSMLIGGALSLPTLFKWASSAVSMMMKGYAAIAKKLGATKHAENMKSRSEVIAQAGMKYYEKGHHFIQGLFRKLVRAVVISSIAIIDIDLLERTMEWLDSDQGKKRINFVASLIELAATVVLAFYSVEGTIDAIHHAKLKWAGLEGVLSAVKGSHIAEAVAAALGSALSAIINTVSKVAEALSKSAVSAALMSKAEKDLRSSFDEFRSAFMSGVAKVGEAAKSAGISETAESVSG